MLITSDYIHYIITINHPCSIIYRFITR